MSDENTQVIVDTAVRAADPSPLSDDAALYTVVVPIAGRLEVIDVEDRLARHRDAPVRKQGTVDVTDPASLSQYVNTHRQDSTVLYAAWRTGTVVAVLNDHATGGAGWGDHRAVLTLTHTVEWERWWKRNRTIGSQIDFAEHIEDGTAEVMDPTGADLLEMAQAFEATKTVEFQSGDRLKDGQRQLKYVETIAAKAGEAGRVTIPDAILLRLAPYEGSEPVHITARIRYRIDGGQLRIGYVLDRPEDALREAFDQVVGQIEADTTLTALRGTPRQ